MKKLLLCTLLLSGLYAASSHAVVVNVTLDPGPVGSTLPAQTVFQLPDLVGINLATDDLAVNVAFTDGKLLGMNGVVNAIIRLTTDPAGGFGGGSLNDSGIFTSDGSNLMAGSITNATLGTFNLFGGGAAFDLASVRYGDLLGSGVVTAATFMIFESALIKAGPDRVPAPATLSLFALGLLGLAGMRRRA